MRQERGARCQLPVRERLRGLVGLSAYFMYRYIVTFVLCLKIMKCMIAANTN